MKFLVSLGFLFLISLNVLAQGKSNIKGKVTAVDDSPIESAAVFLAGSKKGTLTDTKGEFYFSGLEPGNYSLSIQVLGSEEYSINIVVSADQTAVADIKFSKENIMSMQEVVVDGRVNKFSKKESIYVSKLPLKNLENPQVYISVPKALFEEQVAVDLGSISKNIPGSGVPTLANQGRVTFLSRGFQTEPMVRNGVAGFAYSIIDPVNLERIEAIKGPSATLYGSELSYYGGLFNRVTKKPYNGFGGSIGYTTGSWNFNRLTFDVNTPVNEDKTLLFRLNGATSSEKSFQDIGFARSLTLAPSFSYQVSERLSVLFDIEFGMNNSTSPVRFTPHSAGTKNLSIVDLQFPYDRSFGSEDMAYKTQMLNIFAQANYKISDQWISQTIVSRARSSIGGYLTGLVGRSDTTLRSQMVVGATDFVATDFQQNFIGDFKIGSRRNRLIVGLDYYNNANFMDRVTVNSRTINFTDPAATYPALSKKAIDTLLPNGSVRNQRTSTYSYSVYASDVIDLTQNLHAMLSLRVDMFRSRGSYNYANGLRTGDYNQTALAPKFGLVYQLIKDRASIFGNYMSGFTNQTGTDVNGNIFKPEQASQWEFGLKGDIFDHKLIGTISYYNITVDNIVREDLDNVGFSKQDGTQLSKGLDVELTANPIRGLNIVAGYTYNDSKNKKTDKAIEGLRPALSGPANMANFWISYKIEQGKIKGFGVGFGGNFGSSSYAVNTETVKITIPSYQLFDATVFYDQTKYRIGVKLDNITSQQTWSRRLAPQPPFSFKAVLALKF